MWGPILVVVVAGLVGWAAAVVGGDAFATRALSVTIVVALVATLPSWLSVGRWQGFAAAAAVKLAGFLLLAPQGPATLLLSYAELRWQPGAMTYFWFAPPLLLLVTAVEGWLIRVFGDGRRIRDTRLWARRRRVFALLLAGGIAAVTWRLGRVEYYLWRMRAHDHGPSSFALSRVGEGALPRIYRELDDLGERDVGAFRSDLVYAIVQIHHDRIAGQIGDPLVSSVQVSLVEPDPALVAAIGGALEREPDLERRKTISMWTGRLDFNGVIEVFCRTFPQVPTSTRALMIAYTLATESIVATATRPPAGDRAEPWQDLPAPEIADRQGRMRAKLGCVPPLLVEALEADVAAWPRRKEPFWIIQAVELLTQLRPLPPELGSRLLALLPQTDNGYIVTRILGGLGQDLVASGSSTLQQALIDLWPSAKTRREVGYWMKTPQAQAAGIDAEAAFCALFERVGVSEREDLFVLLGAGSPPEDPCVIATLMAAYEELALARVDGLCGEDPEWLPSVRYRLRLLRPTDPQIAAWAGSLAPRVTDPCKADALRRLHAPEQ